MFTLIKWAFYIAVFYAVVFVAYMALLYNATNL